MIVWKEACQMFRPSSKGNSPNIKLVNFKYYLMSNVLLTSLLVLLVSYVFGTIKLFGQKDGVIHCSGCQEIEVVDFEQAQLQLSLQVNNLQQPSIDPNVAALRFMRLLGYRNWVPLGAKKQTLCGTVAHYNIHKLGREKDHNFQIIPHKPFKYLMEKALPRKQKDLGEGILNWHDCYDGEDNCMESEVTPSEEFVENNGSAYFESLWNCDICAYGAWVSERLHNHRPEIHPGEIVWFKEDEAWKIFLFQDESRRFHKKRRFKRIDRKKSKKRDIVPWVTDTLTAEVRLYFSLEETETVKALQFEILEAPQHIIDDWKGKTHLIKLHNKGASIKVEQIGASPLISINNVKVCDDNGIKKGYIQFVTETYQQNGKQGYLLLEVKEIL